VPHRRYSPQGGAEVILVEFTKDLTPDELKAVREAFPNGSSPG
jgi:hypothetical protein